MSQHRVAGIGDDEEIVQKQPLINAPWIVLALIACFVGVHVWRENLIPDEQLWFTLTYAFTPARYVPPQELSGYAFPGGTAGDIWTFVSHMFLHGDWVHLIINCVWMLIFGSVVARRLGALRFLLLSAVCAAAGAAANLVVYSGHYAILVGASGAISGQMAAAIRLMFAGHQPLSRLNHADVRRAPVLSVAGAFRNGRSLRFIIIWNVINIVFGVVGLGVSGDMARIAWEAHLGGFAAGLLLFSWFDRRYVP